MASFLCKQRHSFPPAQALGALGSAPTRSTLCSSSQLPGAALPDLLQPQPPAGHAACSPVCYTVCRQPRGSFRPTNGVLSWPRVTLRAGWLRAGPSRGVRARPACVRCRLFCARGRLSCARWRLSCPRYRPACAECYSRAHREALAAPSGKSRPERRGGRSGDDGAPPNIPLLKLHFAVARNDPEGEIASLLHAGRGDKPREK